tara:strand:+ start:1122 stop:1574 length:453 start_codon:yes stop_codon:yes gene_type:complete
MFIDEKLYAKIIHSIPVVTVDLVIFNLEKNKVLLFKRNNEPLKDNYYTPGGRVNKNETLNNAIIRKSKEELGIDIEINNLQYCGMMEEFFETTKFEKVSNGTHHINILYKFTLNNIDNIKLDNQHNEFKWFDIKDTNLHHYIKDKINICL